jgi:hypothetical protein
VIVHHVCVGLCGGLDVEAVCVSPGHSGPFAVRPPRPALSTPHSRPLLRGRRDKPNKKARLCRRVEWQRPIFPEGCPSSIIGAERLHFRVRDGNGCFPFAIVTTPPACTNLQYPDRIERISKKNNRVETRGFEPLTSAVQRRRSSN